VGRDEKHLADAGDVTTGLRCAKAPRTLNDYVGPNFQLQMAWQGFSGPLHTTIRA
jgi:hypothetical protein